MDACDNCGSDPDARDPQCIRCVIASSPTRIVKNQQNRRKSGKRRARRDRLNDAWFLLKWVVAFRTNERCVYCTKKLPVRLWTIDHIKPKSAGGDDSLDNLVLACTECNSDKGSKPFFSFLFHERNWRY